MEHLGAFDDMIPDIAVKRRFPNGRVVNWGLGPLVIVSFLSEALPLFFSRALSRFPNGFRTVPIIWWSEVGPLSVALLFGVLILGLIGCFVVGYAKRPYRWLAVFGAALAAVAATDYWLSTEGGVAIFAGPVLIHPSEPWNTDRTESLDDAIKVVASCDTFPHDSQRLYYEVTFRDGASINIENALPSDLTPAAWIDAVWTLRPWLDRPTVRHEASYDVFGRPNMTARCLRRFHATLSPRRWSMFSQLLRLSPTHAGR